MWKNWENGYITRCVLINDHTSAALVHENNPGRHLEMMAPGFFYDFVLYHLWALVSDKMIASERSKIYEPQTLYY